MFFIGTIALLFLTHVYADVEYRENMHSFSHAIKARRCVAGNEIGLYEHRYGPGVITEQWYTGSGCFDDRTIVRYYIDGESKPSIEANLFMMHGIGFYHPGLPPWGTKWIGHVASDGGLYNTYRIPFQKSICITFISMATNSFWYIVRGVENYPVVIGDITLPTKARLVLHKIEDQTFAPYTYVPLVKTTNKTGMVFGMALRGESPNFWWLEGCFGTFVTDPSGKTVIDFLSSGTEDMFLSAYYFNKGIFHTDDSGLTFVKRPGTMSAYKFFHKDPIVIRDDFTLMWRCSEKMNSDNCWLVVPENEEANNSSNSTSYTKSPKLRFLTKEQREEELKTSLNDGHHPAKITSYVWTYEW